MALNQNTVVIASAGTGKTRRLVGRYVELLEAGVEPLEIAAVTFTEKAAAEMRGRIRDALYSKIETVPPAARGRWMRILGALPAAPISTIHGFCGFLLRERGMDIGIDPSFSILDEQRSLDLARESTVDVIRQEVRAGSAETELLFGDLGLDALTETMVRAGYWLNSLGHGAGWLAERVADQQRAADELRQTHAAEIEKYGRDFERIGEAADDADARKARNHPLRKRDDPRALLPRLGQIAGVRPAAELARLVGLSIERFMARKRTANALDFDDLLLGVRDLLRDSAPARLHYRQRFRALLVDEFQDTDEVQAEILNLLAGDPAETDPSPFASGKLFIVGDPKQSIYRFRRARLPVFMRTAHEIISAGGATEFLTDNYRSAGPLVEFSNRLSEHVMNGVGKHDLPDSIDLSYRIKFSDAHRMKPASGQPFLGLTLISASPDARAAEGRPMEAEALARLFEGWKASGAIERWKDVGILMRAMTNVGLYVDALEARRIPVFLVQGTMFYQKTEVSDLIAVLELVLRPKDALLRTTVLTSSLIGVTFREFLEGRMASALDSILEPWVARRDQATAAEILEDIIRKTSFDAVLMAQKNGPQRMANVGKLIEITRSLAREGASGLDDVVRHLRARARDASVREPEAQAPGQTDDAVSVLTVHQAKGLEFDVVAVPDLAARTRGSSGDRAIFSDRWGPLIGASYGLHRRPLPHALMLEAQEEDEDQQYEEEKRLLYVAVTRARKMLVLGEGFASRGGPWRDWVEETIETVQSGAMEKAREGKPLRVRFRGGGQNFFLDIKPAALFTGPEQLPLGIDLESISRAARFRDFQNMASVARPASVPASLEMTPSELTELSACFRRFHWTRILGLSEPGREEGYEGEIGDPSALQLGLAAHTVLEKGSGDPAGLRAQGLGDLDAVLQSAAWHELKEAHVERELPFAVRVDLPGKEDSPACLVRGRIDAVAAFDPPRAIDYKFARWKDGADTAYRTQMLAYVLALMKSAGIDRAVGELWFLRAPMRIVRREYSREEAETDLASLFQRYAEAIRSGEWSGIERADCDRLHCGFRSQCWPAAEGSS